jgi:tetratricopeptide (TPR) repeat protein
MICAILGVIYFISMLSISPNDLNKKNELQITSSDLLTQMNILYKQKKYAIVENLAKNYLKRNQDDDIRNILTKTLYNSGRIRESIDQAQKILKNQSKNIEIRLFLSKCYLDIVNPMKAIKILQEILEIEPDNISALEELAKIYFTTNQKKSALKIYEKFDNCINNTNEQIKNKLTLIELYNEFGDFQSSIREYANILKYAPDNLNIKKELAELYKKTMNNEALINLLTEICENPQNSDENLLWAMGTLVEIYISEQNYTKALDYSNLIKNNPTVDPIKAEENFIKILFYSGKVDESIELLNSIIAKEPENINLKKILAQAQLKNKNFKEAIKTYEEIIEISETEHIEKLHLEISNIYANWGLYLFSKNEIEPSFKCFTNALKYYDKNPDIYYNLGKINKKIKNFPEAITQYKNAIELDSQNALYYFKLSECYEEIDNIYEQKNFLAKSLEYNPHYTKAHYKLGRVYEMQNDVKNAILYFKKAVDIDDNFVLAKHRLALLLEHIGEIDNAIRLYEDILSIEPNNKEIANNLKMLTE